MKKKILSVVLAAAMTMSLLAGCGGSASTDAPATDSSSASTSTDTSAADTSASTDTAAADTAAADTDTAASGDKVHINLTRSGKEG